MPDPNMGAVFARGSVSLRLYPHNDRSPSEVVAELCHQAGMAGEAGFDGIMTSEHHGGFPGYLPNPLQTVSFVLDDCPQVWAAACPLLLPLRPAAMVAEEVAWLAARHPGRVGVGVAAGALALDFEAMGVPFSSAGARFKADLPRLVEMLRGQELGPLREDPALRSCRSHPVPVLSAAVSIAAATRAAHIGAGILMEGMSPAQHLAQVTAGYDDAGGTAGKVLIRRVWLGDIRSDLVERQRQVYDSYAGATAAFGDDQTLTANDPVRMAELLSEVAADTGADALNLRIHLPGMSPEVIRDQISRLGNEVLPLLRERWTSGPTNG